MPCLAVAVAVAVAAADRAERSAVGRQDGTAVQTVQVVSDDIK